jgi:hypothetical protein
MPETYHETAACQAAFVLAAPLYWGVTRAPDRAARISPGVLQMGVLQMIDTRIKPHLEQQEEEARRAEQQRQFRRNQVFGLVLVAALICAWWLFHTNPKWIFPPGWWRP